MTALLLAAGLAGLIAGAELLVRGASHLAGRLRVSPLVIGLTVVAFGTSAPELAVSVDAARQGQADLSLGNVVGSNIFNVLGILGLSALIVPLAVAQKVVRFDVPLMIGASGLVAVLGRDGSLHRGDGVLLVTGLVAWTIWSIVESRRESASIQVEYELEFAPPVDRSLTGGLRDAVCVIAGLGLLMLGARWFVSGSMDVARWLGVSERVIGLTIVAVGTSLPEVATSVMAALRGERDIAVGNVVGSNLFNILGVLGASAAIAPAGVAVSGTALAVDIPVMIAAAAICLPVCFTGGRITRREGFLLLAGEVGYLAFLIAQN